MGWVGAARAKKHGAHPQHPRSPHPTSTHQDPELRAKFAGSPEHVINYLFLVAEDLRHHMAAAGVAKVADLVGRADLLTPDTTTIAASPKLAGIDLSMLLTPAASLRPGAPQTCVEVQDHGLEEALDASLVWSAAPVLAAAAAGKAPAPIVIASPVVNTNRAVGTTLSHEVTKRTGAAGLPPSTIRLQLTGSAGQSLGAFLAPGVTIDLAGDANDYVGKGLSGGIIAVYPPADAAYEASDAVVVGNVALYGATSGSAFFAGIAAERFAVRNSGASAVVEGVGDHACEYMTGGVVVVLGGVGKNFGAGMSGGLAFIHDPDHALPARASEDVAGDLLPLEDAVDVETVRSMLAAHVGATRSKRAAALLADWPAAASSFVKVFPHEYAAALAAAAAAADADLAHAAAIDAARAAEEADARAFAAASPPTADAWAELVALGMEPMARGVGLPPPPAPSGTPAADAARLAADAAAGLPVAGRVPTWAADRPAIVPAGTANKARGFLDYGRAPPPYRPVEERVKDWDEVLLTASTRAPANGAPSAADSLATQSARCMGCGTPFCHQTGTGCPLGNKVPEFNALVAKGAWRAALDRLLETNNFPEFTGRVCPAPCEGACVAGINGPPVSIKGMEAAIIDRAFEEGWMVPRPPPPPHRPPRRHHWLRPRRPRRRRPAQQGGPCRDRV